MASGVFDLVRFLLFASGSAAAGDHLHFFHVERGLRRRTHARGGRGSSAATRIRCGAGAAGIRSGAGAAGIRGSAGALARTRAARFGAGNPHLVTHVIAQLRGISGQLIGLARLIGQREIAGRAAQAAFNRLAVVV